METSGNPRNKGGEGHWPSFLGGSGMDGFLFDVKVLELADEKGEFCGKLLAGAGADVLKIEPPGGQATREIGPFYHVQAHPNAVCTSGTIISGSAALRSI